MKDLYDWEVLEQVALFSLSVDLNAGNAIKEGIEGQSGVINLLVENAIAFNQQYSADDVWEDNDWYVVSDLWFDTKIAPALYEVWDETQ